MLLIFAMLVLSGALPFMFGRMVGDGRQGRALFVVPVPSCGCRRCLLGENIRQSALVSPGRRPGHGQHEGKELHFGQALTALLVVVTTGLSCGAVNAMQASLTPLGGLVPLALIHLGEVPPWGRHPDVWRLPWSPRLIARRTLDHYGISKHCSMS